MQRRLCEMSEAKWSITEAKCLQISHNKYASQRDAISTSMGNIMLSHSAGMHHPDISIAGICPNKFERAKGSKRFHFASLHYIFSAYLPTHIKFLTEFHRIFFGTTYISFHKKNISALGGADIFFLYWECFLGGMEGISERGVWLWLWCRRPLSPLRGRGCLVGG